MNMIDDDWIYTTRDQHLPSKGDTVPRNLLLTCFFSMNIKQNVF